MYVLFLFITEKRTSFNSNCFLRSNFKRNFKSRFIWKLRNFIKFQLMIYSTDCWSLKCISISISCINPKYQTSRVMGKEPLQHMWTGKVQASMRIRAVSPEPIQFAKVKPDMRLKDWFHEKPEELFFSSDVVQISFCDSKRPSVP